MREMQNVMFPKSTVHQAAALAPELADLPELQVAQRVTGAAVLRAAALAGLPVLQERARQAREVVE